MPSRHVRWCGRGRGEPGPYPIPGETSPAGLVIDGPEVPMAATPGPAPASGVCAGGDAGTPVASGERGRGVDRVEAAEPTNFVVRMG